MTWFSEGETGDASRMAEQALRLPIGAASPLWFAYAGLAGASVAYWWMLRLARPMNLEAFGWAMPQTSEPNLPAVIDETMAALQPEPVNPEPVREAAERMADEAAASAGEAAQVASMAADDLTRLVGVGPTLAAKLQQLGVRTFADIAAWTNEDVERVDEALDLKGRASREKWVDQARQFAEQ